MSIEYGTCLMMPRLKYADQFSPNMQDSAAWETQCELQ